MTVYEQNSKFETSLGRKCIVVANRVGARVFVKHGNGDPTLFKTFEHLQGRLHDRDIGTDKPGRSFESWSGTSTRHSLSAESSPHELDLEQFTTEVARELQKNRQDKVFDDLILVAEPRFSGALFGQLDEETRHLVSQKIHKDLANMNENEVLNYLKKAGV